MAGIVEEDLVTPSPSAKPGGFFEDDAVPIDENFFEDDAVKVDGGVPWDDIGDFLAGAVTGPASQVAETLTAPMMELDKLTGAPPRAAVGAIQRGEGLGAAGDAFVGQLKAGIPLPGDDGIRPGIVLPTVPSGEDIARKGMAKAGIAEPFADKMAPMMGAATEGFLDITQLFPSGLVVRGAEAGAQGAGALAKGVGSIVRKGEGIAAKTLMPIGQVVTQGAINPNKAIKAAALLSSRELMFPGTKDFGAMAKAAQEVGNARTMLRFEKLSVPGSHDVALQISDLINANKGRTIAHPHADELINQIRGKAFTETQRMVPQVVPPQLIEGGIMQAEAEIANMKQMIEANRPAFAGKTEGVELGQMIDQLRVQENHLAAIKQQYLRGEPFTVNRPVTALEPRDLTLDELDDITGMLDELVYTGQGNEKSLRRVWGPTLKTSRAALDNVMQTIPEGELFKEKKGKYEALATAGKHRSKLMEAMSLVGAMGAGAITFNPTSLLILSLRPRSYFQMMGLIKAPREMVEALNVARATGKAGAVRDALTSLAGRYPEVTERVIRSSLLISGKPEAQQYLTEEEAGSLSLNRVFDPDQIMAEKDRIQRDKTMSSVEKAKKLSEINKNGYIVVDTPMMSERGGSPEEKVFGGREGLDTLIQSLQRSH